MKVGWMSELKVFGYPPVSVPEISRDGDETTIGKNRFMVGRRKQWVGMDKPEKDSYYAELPHSCDEWMIDEDEDLNVVCLSLLEFINEATLRCRNLRKCV